MIMSEKAYYFEVGIENFDENIKGQPLFYGIPYETTDENTGEFQTLNEAFNYVTEYIKNGVNTTYGLIFEVDVSNEEYNSIYNGISNYYDYSYMFEGKLKYSAYKNENGEYITICNDTK
jgi:hypothetical protein